MTEIRTQQRELQAATGPQGTHQAAGTPQTSPAIAGEAGPLIVTPLRPCRTAGLDSLSGLVFWGYEDQATIVSSNDERDAWLYRARCKGTPDKEIRRELARLVQEKHWEPLGTDQGVRRAADRYAERRKLPAVPRRKRQSR